ncbi:MAG TPA: lipoate--protein ligase [Candidatus Kapabacteria bacterium]|nr:lipoate--protein ligase [Candidatus Kapabacteria bacterium]
MLCIYNNSTDPYFNMATEDYLFHKFNDDIFMLWRNDNAIIVGKHQNTLAEINLDVVRNKNIKVVRRLSGGGAVFHDLGNLNFTFIVNSTEGKLVDFQKYTLPIIEVLNSLDVPAKFEGRNDLTIDGKKFSGNAVHVLKNRVLQHGTILFASEMKDLSDALKVNPLKYIDKTVKSVRARVTNVSDHLKEPLDLESFKNMIMEKIISMYPDAKFYELSDYDKSIIKGIAEEKYSTWDWNYGWHAKYNFEKLIHTNGGNIEFHLIVEDGVIQKAKIFGDYFNIKETQDIEDALIGTRHDIDSIKLKLKQFDIDEYFKNISLEELISGMF